MTKSKGVGCTKVSTTTSKTTKNKNINNSKITFNGFYTIKVNLVVCCAVEMSWQVNTMYGVLNNFPVVAKVAMAHSPQSYLITPGIQTRQCHDTAPAIVWLVNNLLQP